MIRVRHEPSLREAGICVGRKPVRVFHGDLRIGFSMNQQQRKAQRADGFCRGGVTYVHAQQQFGVELSVSTTCGHLSCSGKKGTGCRSDPQASRWRFRPRWL